SDSEAGSGAAEGSSACMAANTDDGTLGISAIVLSSKPGFWNTYSAGASVRATRIDSGVVPSTAPAGSRTVAPSGSELKLSAIVAGTRSTAPAGLVSLSIHQSVPPADSDRVVNAAKARNATLLTPRRRLGRRPISARAIGRAARMRPDRSSSTLAVGIAA